jgi:capsular exopolysaccharide synthesis family protein
MGVPAGQQQVSGGQFDTVAINTEIEVIKSASLAMRVVRELKLDQDPEFHSNSAIVQLLDRLGLMPIANHVQRLYAYLLGKTAEDPDVNGEPEGAGDVRIERATAILGERLHVDRVRSSYVLAVSVSSHSPERARQVTAKIIDDYLADQGEMRKRALQQTTLWLKERLSALKSHMDETETAIEKLNARSGRNDSDKGNDKEISDLKGQLTSVRLVVAEKRTQLEQAQHLPSDDNSAALTSPMIKDLRLQKVELTSRKAALGSKAGDRYPEVLAVNQRLAAINDAIHDEAERIRLDLKNGLDIAVRREQSLEASLGRLTGQTDNGDYVRSQQLHRIAIGDSKLYDDYFSQYNEIETRASLPVVEARIISPATVPPAPIFPRHKFVFCLAAAFLGFAAGVVLALLAEYSERSIRTGAQAEQMFGFPVLGGLPLMLERSSSLASSDDPLVRMIVDAPRSTFSEAIRSIRISLSVSDHHHTPLVVLVTSCLPGEGKSTIATLLAASSAGAHKKTLLVDCDMRGRTISQRVNKPVPGLAELLSGGADIATVTERDLATGCFVIPAGFSSDSPGDLLSGNRMNEIIERLRGDFDYIVLDTPPLLPVVDTITLLPIADKVLLIIDSEARSDNIVNAFKLLAPKADRIAGMVFNKLSAKQLRHYSYHSYYTA